MTKQSLQSMGRFIKFARTRKEMTQQDLADACDLHVNYIGGIERGERNPTFLVLIRLSKILPVSLGIWVGNKYSMHKSK